MSMKPPVLKIRTYGDPCLRKLSEPIEQIGVSERLLIEVMFNTMYAEKGIGLAAPQVGINQQLIVLDIGEGPFVFANPKIIKASGLVVLEEGCLSVPGGVVEVERPETITVEYLDINNQPSVLECDGLLARAIQHENDHLIGKLIVDYADAQLKEKIETYFFEDPKE